MVYGRFRHLPWAFFACSCTGTEPCIALGPEHRFGLGHLDRNPEQLSSISSPGRRLVDRTGFTRHALRCKGLASPLRPFPSIVHPHLPARYVMALPSTAIPASVRSHGPEARVSRSGAPSAPKPFLVAAAPLLSPQHPKLMARVDAIASSTKRVQARWVPQEPEDAKLTGATRSLNRRLLGLNVGGSLMRPAS